MRKMFTFRMFEIGNASKVKLKTESRFEMFFLVWKMHFHMIYCLFYAYLITNMIGLNRFDWNLLKL